MPKVGIVMGSDSDMKVMSKAADMLEKLGVEYEVSGNFVPEYIPGCEPCNSGPCNAGYWRYQVNEV